MAMLNNQRVTFLTCWGFTKIRAEKDHGVLSH